MELITVPSGLRGPREDGYSLAVGPFAMTHNGQLGLGTHLIWNGEEYVVSDSARTYVLDDAYTVRVSGDLVTFYSEEYASKFVLRPLTQEDVEWIYPGEGDAPLEDVKMTIITETQPY
jgi:hypothetical protein